MNGTDRPGGRRNRAMDATRTSALAGVTTTIARAAMLSIASHRGGQPAFHVTATGSQLQLTGARYRTKDAILATNAIRTRPRKRARSAMLRKPVNHWQLGTNA
jgi:hypothetical protein